MGAGGAVIGGASAWFSMLATLALILLALFGAAWLVQKTRFAKFGGAGQQAARINVLATRQIGWQCALLIIEADGNRFLIGAGRHGLTAIGRLENPARQTAPDIAP